MRSAAALRSMHVSSPLVHSDVLAPPRGYRLWAHSSQLACTHSFTSFAKSSAPPRCRKEGELTSVLLWMVFILVHLCMDACCHWSATDMERV